MPFAFRTDAMPIQEPDLLQALRAVVDPETGRDLVASKQLRNLRITAHDRDEEQSFFVGIQDAVEVGR